MEIDGGSAASGAEKGLPAGGGGVEGAAGREDRDAGLEAVDGAAQGDVLGEEGSAEGPISVAVPQPADEGDGER